MPSINIVTILTLHLNALKPTLRRQPHDGVQFKTRMYSCHTIQSVRDLLHPHSRLSFSPKIDLPKGNSDFLSHSQADVVNLALDPNGPKTAAPASMLLCPRCVRMALGADNGLIHHVSTDQR